MNILKGIDLKPFHAMFKKDTDSKHENAQHTVIRRQAKQGNTAENVRTQEEADAGENMLR